MKNEIINKKIKAFKYIDETQIKNALDKREEFLKQFSKDKISSLTKEKYVLGIEESKNDSFCYWLERILPFGSIRGANAAKFGVYYGIKKGETKKKWQWTKWTNENFDVIKKELHDLIIAGEEKNYDKIETNKLSPMFKGKILAIYFPKDYLTVYSFKHIRYFLKQFGVDASKSIEKSKKQLLEIKNNYDKIKEWDNNKFVVFLYTTFPEVMKKKDIVPEIDSGNIQIITDARGYFSKEKKGEKKRNSGKPDYEKAAKDRNNIGKAGEKAVYEFEKKRLFDANRKDLSDKVEWISKKDDSKGYDIKSYDEKTGFEIHIEVKTTNNNSYNNMSFYLTDNELKKLKEDESCIYYVFDIKKAPKIRIVDKEKLLNDFDKLANPILYKIDCELK